MPGGTPVEISMLLNAYDEGYREAMKIAKNNLYEKPYMMYWCRVCDKPGTPKEDWTDYIPGVRNLSLLPGMCSICNYPLIVGQHSYREQLEMHYGVRKRPEFAEAE